MTGVWFSKKEEAYNTYTFKGALRNSFEGASWSWTLTTPYISTQVQGSIFKYNLNFPEFPFPTRDEYLGNQKKFWGVLGPLIISSRIFHRKKEPTWKKIFFLSCRDWTTTYTSRINISIFWISKTLGSCVDIMSYISSFSWQRAYILAY